MLSRTFLTSTFFIALLAFTTILFTSFTYADTCSTCGESAGEGHDCVGDAQQAADKARERSQEAVDDMEESTMLIPVGGFFQWCKDVYDAADALEDEIEAKKAATLNSCGGGCGAEFLGDYQGHREECYRYPHIVNGSWWYSCQRDRCPLWHTVPPGYTSS